MTGKEALKLAQDTILAHNGNNKSSFTMKNLYLVEEELNEKDKKLTKYTRAFEILKDKLDIKLAVCDGLNKKKIYMLISTIHGGIIPKEDKKLLEELMKGE